MWHDGRERGWICNIYVISLCNHCQGNWVNGYHSDNVDIAVMTNKDVRRWEGMHIRMCQQWHHQRTIIIYSGAESATRKGVYISFRLLATVRTAAVPAPLKHAMNSFSQLNLQIPDMWEVKVRYLQSHELRVCLTLGTILAGRHKQSVSR